VQSKSKVDHADVTLGMINSLYGLERDLKDVSQEQRFIGR